MKKGIRGHDVRREGIVNICSRCKEAGIEYLQLVLEKSDADFKFGNFSTEYANKVKEQLGDTKIAILGSYINPSEPDDELWEKEIGKFKEKIRYATVLNPIAVGTETGRYKDGETHSEAAYQRVLSAMREIVKEAEKYNVDIAVEGVHCLVISSPKVLARLIKDLDSERAKVIFDPVNYMNTETYKHQDEIINDMFELLSDKMVAIHAKDFKVENGELKVTRPGTGMLNYELIFKNLKERNMNIPFISEDFCDDDAVVAFEYLEGVEKGV